MDGPAPPQHPHDLALRLVGHVRQRDLACHHIARQVGEQAQIRQGVEQVERQQQIVGHPAANVSTSTGTGQSAAILFQLSRIRTLSVEERGLISGWMVVRCAPYRDIISRTTPAWLD
nr:hypothetical protein [uncultured Lichenicoccus sp.]